MLSTSALYGFGLLYFYLLKNPVYNSDPNPIHEGDEWGRLCHCIFLGICIIIGLCFITNCASHKYQGCKHFEFGARWRFSNGFDDFYIWPTKSVSTVVPVGFQSGVYAMLKSLDTSGTHVPHYMSPPQYIQGFGYMIYCISRVCRN